MNPNKNLFNYNTPFFAMQLAALTTITHVGYNFKERPLHFFPGY